MLQHHGGSGLARGGHDSCSVHDPLAEAQVRIVVVALAVVVVHVQVAQVCTRVVEPVIQAAADAGVPDVEDESEPMEVEVAGMGEVRAPGSRHVLDDDLHPQFVLPRAQRLEGAVQLGDHGGVARTNVRAPVGWTT